MKPKAVPRQLIDEAPEVPIKCGSAPGGPGLEPASGSRQYGAVTERRGTFPAWRLAPACSQEEAVSVPRAKELLGLRLEWTVNLRAALGALEPCWLPGEVRGVTLSSVERERSWWETASFRQRFVRRLLTPLNFV